MDVRRMSTDEMIILVDGQSGRVRLVALDVPHLRARLLKDYAGCVPVTGELARVLYEALAGRDYVDDVPAAASMGRAMAATSTLLRHMQNEPGYGIALAALRNDGETIRPWLGTSTLDENGFVVVDVEAIAIPV